MATDTTGDSVTTMRVMVACGRPILEPYSVTCMSVLRTVFSHVCVRGCIMYPRLSFAFACVQVAVSPGYGG